MSITAALQEILLVEDNDDDAEIITSIFRKNNIQNPICRRRNGEDALEYLFQKGKDEDDIHKNIPSIVLLDINLPKLTGIDVLRRMRAHTRTKNIPVFIFTSSTSDYNAFESYRLGVTSYIRKQTSFEKFEKALLETEIYLKDYKVLIVDDNWSDAAIILDELNNSPLKCHCELATTREEYKKALVEFRPDIIFCDYDLPPMFDAIQAVRILKETDLKIPFILVTGKLNEDLASACLIEGMDDYLIKDKMKRFPVSLINNLRKKKIEIEKNEAIGQLQKSEKLFRALIEKNTDMMTLTLPNGKLMYGSPSVTTILGYTKEEYLTRSVFEFIHPEDLLNIMEQEKDLINSSGKTCYGQQRLLHKNGNYIWCEGSIKNMVHDPSIGALVSNFRDITERKKAEENQSKMNSDLIGRNKDLEQFSYIISHNLRAPIANITGATSALNNKISLNNEEKDALIHGLNVSAGKLDAVVKDLNFILQIKAEVSEENELVKFSDILNEVNLSIHEEIEFSGAEIKGNFQEIEEIFILKGYLTSIFFNLISNSIKYKMLNHRPCIQVESHRYEDRIELIFKDNGLGIDLLTKGEHVFGLYKRFHTHVEGQGMGLYMVKTQVESLGGKISILSEVNKGTEFKIQLPI